MRLEPITAKAAALTALLLGATFITGSFGAPPPNPVPPADPAIAYQGGSALCVMNADGSNATTIYSSFNRFEVLQLMPSWSPNGHTIAFRKNNLADIWLIDVAVSGGVPTGSTPRPFLVHDAIYNYKSPAWSPLGGEIATVRYKDGEAGVVVAPVAGGPLEPIYTITFSSIITLWEPTWSPDGGRIAFAERSGTSSEILVVDRHTGAVTPALQTAPGWTIRAPAWARTSDRIAYQLASDSGAVPTRIYILDLATGVSTLVVAGYWPTWSPNDSRLLFQGTRKLSTVDLASGMVTALPTSGDYPDWRCF